MTHDLVWRLHYSDSKLFNHPSVFRSATNCASHWTRDLSRAEQSRAEQSRADEVKLGRVTRWSARMKEKSNPGEA